MDFISLQYLNDFRWRVSQRLRKNMSVSFGSARINGIASSNLDSLLPLKYMNRRIFLDDATALALSDTSIGTLFGGVYMYVGTLATATASPVRGACAFWRISDLPGGATRSYTVSSDAQPNTLLPAYIAGVFINPTTSSGSGVALTKGNFGWIQVAGVASVLFDSGLTATALAATVSTRVSAAIASTFDAGQALTTITLPNVLGVAIGTPVISTISSVIITRGNFCGRI